MAVSWVRAVAKTKDKASETSNTERPGWKSVVGQSACAVLDAACYTVEIDLRRDDKERIVLGCCFRASCLLYIVHLVRQSCDT